MPLINKTPHMQKAKIGVVVPVYKVEMYIAECIESILAQTYTNFRLILVDDGSPDDTGKICNEYAKKDPRITVIHQANAGVTRARARGVVEADDCEWIMFVDGDDTILPQALELMLNNRHNDSKIVITSDDEYVPRDCRIISANDYRNILLKDVSFCNGPVSKLYKRELFNEETFCIPREIVLGEDLLMNLKIAFLNEKDVSINPTRIYNYRMRDGSATHIYRRSIEYEELFYKQLRAIVPIDKWGEYAIQTIDIRLQRFRRFCSYNYDIRTIYNSSFYKELRNDVEKSGYRIKGIEKILFYSNNVCIRFIVINYRKLINVIKKVFS